MKNRNRSCFESMRPRQISREDLKTVLLGGNIDCYELFKLTNLVSSKNDFRRQCKNNSLSIENGHLNFVKVNKSTVVEYSMFMDDLLLLRKGKTQFVCVKL